MDGDQRRDTAALLVFVAHGVAGALGRDHDHVEIFARFDQAEMHVEAMREGEGGALLHVIAQIGLPDFRLRFVGREDHHDVRPLRGIGVRHDGEAGSLCLFRRGRPFTKGDAYFARTAVAQVLGVGMALAAIADDDDVALFDQLAIGIGVVIDFHVKFPVCLFE